MEVRNILVNTKSNFVGGNLAKFLPKWKTFTSDFEILNTVRGLPIKVDKNFEPSDMFQHKLGSNAGKFVQSEISSLLNKQVIFPTSHEHGEHISPIFTRPKQDGSFRLILNLKKLNRNVEFKHFKMETLRSILCLIQQNCFMAKLDIKDAYYTVPIKHSDHKLLKFRFQNKLYKFVALPNGYSEGPRLFTKLLKPILAHLRGNEICIAAYIDDLFTMNRSFESCLSNVKQSSKLLDDMGFTINVSKSIFIPSQKMEFLGFTIDSVAMTVTLTSIKKHKLKCLCIDMLSKESMPIRSVSILLGTITSSLIGVPLGWLHYRSLDRAKTSALFQNAWDFDKPMTLSQAARDDITWWQHNIDISFAPIFIGVPEHTLTTDASGIRKRIYT